MLTIAKTNSEHVDFIKLVEQLDVEIAVIDGADHAFYSQFNKIAAIKHAVVVYRDNIPVGCGGIKELEPGTMEVKRMFTLATERGKGIAGLVLNELEAWVREMGYKKCVLETGQRMPDAIALYKKHGYVVIPNYGQYQGVENSVCFEKLVD